VFVLQLLVQPVTPQGETKRRIRKPRLRMDDNSYYAILGYLIGAVIVWIAIWFVGIRKRGTR